MVENWEALAKVRLNGKPLAGKDRVRIGLSHNEGPATLVVWLKLDATSKTVIQLDPLPN